MPIHHLQQSLARRGRRGLTLLELVLGLALTALVGLVAARMMILVARTSQYTFREMTALSSSRKALLEAGAWRGMARAAREASAYVGLSSTTLALTLPGPHDVLFSTAPNGLVQLYDASSSTQAAEVTGLSITYYHIVSSTGFISEAVMPSSATYALIRVTMTGKSRQKSYDMTTGAYARNR